MRQVLVLVHCQEANRRRVEEGFIERLVRAIRDRGFDEVIHLSAPIIVGRGVNGAENSPIFTETRSFIDRAVEWNYHDSEPTTLDCKIGRRAVYTILEGTYSYDREKMEKSCWNILLKDREDAIPRSIKPFPREFAWVPEVFRDPEKWRDAKITLGGLFEHKCVEDVSQILTWMDIKHHIDPILVSRGTN